MPGCPVMEPNSKNRMIEEEPYLRLSGKLLEGPCYDPDTNMLWFVDIGKDLVHSIDLSNGPESLCTFSVEGNTVGSIALLEGSKELLLVSAKYGFATFNTTTGEVVGYRSYHDDGTVYADQQRFRANDGAVDAKGRILMGVLLDEKTVRAPEGEERWPNNAHRQPEGMLISLDLDGQVHRVVENIVTPNGLAWNSTNTIMYFAESYSGNVYKFDYDIETGKATGKTVFYHVHDHNAEYNQYAPDGLAVDEENHIWLAVWSGAEVLRLSPKGQIVGRLEFRTNYITSLAFVGTDLFVTTAEEENKVDQNVSAEYGGHLYKVDVGVRGLPRYSGRLPQGVDVSRLI